MSNEITPAGQSSGALSAEHYQTFEMAKANDGILGGDDIAQLLVYTASARAKAQAIHAAMAATKNLDDATTLRADAIETEQAYARVSIFGDQRIGELLRDLPKARAGRKANSSTTIEELTKASAIEEAGISRPAAYQLEAMAANPEVVQAVIEKAEAEGRIVSRSQVLKAIKERDAANEALEDAYRTQEAMEDELESLRNRPTPAPEVIEREVIPEDTKRAIRELEESNKQYSKDYESLRQRYEGMRNELQQVRKELNANDAVRDAMHDVKMLTNATNEYVGRYGKQTWNLEGMDEQTVSSLYDAMCDAREFIGEVIDLVNASVA